MPDLAQRSKDDPQFFTGSLWMMTSGSWQVHVTAEGSPGEGRPFGARAGVIVHTKKMQAPIGIVLAALGLLLVAGAVSIVGAGVREGQLEPGLAPDPARVRRARWVMAVTASLRAGMAALGGLWWKSEAGDYDKHIYKPLQMSATLENGERLMLHLTDPGWARWRQVDDLVPDHNHLMHLYVISLPEMDRVWHLHPDRVEAGVFAKDLPSMPAGRYALYGDIVHADGLPETLVTEIALPAVAGKPLEGDDATGAGPPISQRRPQCAPSRSWRMARAWFGSGIQDRCTPGAPCSSASAWKTRTASRRRTWNSIWVCRGTRRSCARTAACLRTCIPRDRCPWLR